MLQLKRNLLSVALASATMLIATGVHAQDAGTQQAQTGDTAVDLDKVTVTGIRAGIENAIDTKKESTSIVEAISAEDIGKLPDLSIAESIARLPGLTAQRVAGRASTISIRGLGDDFSTTLLNGREQASTGNNRGVEFDQYPSELISQVVVYKTPDAALIGQGLSGTVDLQTVRPLSFGERVISLNARGEQNSQGDLNPGYDDTGYRVSASYIDQFLDHTLGVAVGYARLDSPGQANRWEAWGYPTDSQGNNILGGSKAQASSVSNVRDGFMAVVEYKPNDFWWSTLDAYYSTFEVDETLRFMETGLAWSAATPSNTVAQGGNIVSGTFTGVRPVLRNDNNTLDDELLAIGWNNKFKFNEDWSAVADISYSKATRDAKLLETYAGLGAARANDPNDTDTVDFTLDINKHPFFNYHRAADYADPSKVFLTDPGGWGQDGFIKLPSTEDKLTAFRAAATRNFESGIFSNFEFGVNYTDREKTRNSGFEGFLRLKDGPEVAIPASALQSPADIGFVGPGATIAYDIDQVLSLYNFDQLVHQDVTNKNWTVEEKLTTGYVQWDIDANLGSIGLRGNVGVQAVRTDQSSTGMLVPFGEADAPVPISGGAEYTDILPSLNLIFDLAYDQKVRFGLGEQMARPRMDQMRANQNVSINTNIPGGRWEATGGNPELEPWKATAIDLAYEKYFGGRGYVSIAGFNKDLHSFIFEKTVPFDFTGYDSGDLPQPTNNIGVISSPQNGSNGKLYGFETAVSVPFDLLWQPLDGFGLQASYSKFHSEVKEDPNGPNVQLAGLSEEISNITLYYEKYGFSARASQRHRSPFRGEVQGFGGDRDSNRFVNSENILDLQFGYTFAEGTSMEGLSLLLQVNNATNEPYREFLPDVNDLPRTYAEYGRQVLLGATYKF